MVSVATRNIMMEICLMEKVEYFCEKAHIVVITMAIVK